MVKLTNEQIVEICDKVIKSIEKAEKNSEMIFLCYEIRKQICLSLNIIYGEIEIMKYYIPEFTYEMAKKYANAKIGINIWWCNEDNNNKFNYSDRIKFMEWIKSQYQNK